VCYLEIMRCKAIVHSVRFKESASGHEHALAEVVSHWKEGRNGIEVGGLVWTSRVTRKFKNGNFETKNTHYFVVPAPKEEVHV